MTRAGPGGRVLAAIARHAAAAPAAPALEGEHRALDYATLAGELEHCARLLRARRPAAVGLLAENGPDWALADLACLDAGIPLVPLPTFFSASQLAHVVERAGIDLVLTDRPHALPFAGHGASPFHGELHAVGLSAPPMAFPLGTAKITFTSGTTGAPKGVCLAAESMARVAASLVEASGAHAGDRHLALLPLSTLLENVGGLYAPLLAGACACLLPGARVGLAGSSEVAPLRLVAALDEAGATTAILVPQLLEALVATLEAGVARPRRLRYLAVGGAAVPPRLLARAAALDLCVFEGYGLSECASVVTLNRRRDNLPGSVGRPLAHASLRIGEDGAIAVHGAGFLGYLGEPAAGPGCDGWVDTGDLGRLDADGRLHLLGRRKHLFITAFGRNVAPEWVERELLAQRAIAQAAVFGEGRAFNVAVVVAQRGADDRAIDQAVAAANRELPDYARVGAWLHAAAAFTVANGALTANGRPRREAIAAAHAEAIEHLYHRHEPGENRGQLC